MKLILDGMAEGLHVTDGLGADDEPPPPVPEAVEDTILGGKEGGLFDSNENPALENEE